MSVSDVMDDGVSDVIGVCVEGFMPVVQRQRVELLRWLWHPAWAHEKRRKRPRGRLRRALLPYRIASVLFALCACATPQAVVVRPSRRRHLPPAFC